MKNFISLFLLLVFPVFADQPNKPLKRGLAAHYYSDPAYWGGNWPDEISVPNVDPSVWTFKSYAYSRIEPLINHLFIRRGWFSVRWKGFLDTKHDEGQHKGERKGTNYSFEIHADDGCRLIIDGKIIIDDWRPCSEISSSSIRKSPSIYLEDGFHEITVEYFQGQSLKKEDKDPMKLYWFCPDYHIPRQIIPASRFYHTTEQAEAPERNISLSETRQKNIKK